MTERKRLKREVQCAKCPWKVSTDPRKIPGGYDAKWHRGLKSTIAKPGVLNIGSPIRLMACHDTEVGAESPCLGWLMNQLGPGNNIGLRLAMMDYDLTRVKLVGEQHECFEDTLP